MQPFLVLDMLFSMLNLLFSVKSHMLNVISHFRSFSVEKFFSVFSRTAARDTLLTQCCRYGVIIFLLRFFVINMSKILFLQKNEVSFCIVYLFAICKHQSV